jgi:ABC-type uncharacterized transport system auxiliary subunit
MTIKALPKTILLLSFILMVGCGPDRESSTIRRYSLETINPKQASVTFDKTINIRTFDIAEQFSTNSLVYRLSPIEYEIDYYKEFITTPNSLITQQFQYYLDNTNLFATVTGPASLIASDFYLEGQIRKLYGDVTDKEKPAAVIEIKIHVLKNISGKEKVLFTKTYSASKALTQKTTDELITTYNKCLEMILSEVSSDLQTKLQKK